MSGRHTPTLFAFMLRHAALGFCVGVMLAAALIGANVAGLRGLIFNSDNGWIGGLVLAFSIGTTFGGFQSGVAVMRLGENQTTEPQGGRRIGARMIPARVRARR
jgi:hypothetical protein